MKVDPLPLAVAFRCFLAHETVDALVVPFFISPYDPHTIPFCVPLPTSNYVLTCFRTSSLLYLLCVQEAIVSSLLQLMFLLRSRQHAPFPSLLRTNRMR